MSAVRTGLGLALLASALAACGDDEPTPSNQQLVYVEQTAGGNPGGRIVRVAADGGQRKILWEMPSGSTTPLSASLYPSTSGATILVLQYDPSGWFTLPSNGGAAATFSPPENAGAPQWSPDASLIAWLVGDSPRLGVATLGSTSITMLTPDSIIAQRYQWSPDGAQFVFEGQVVGTSSYRIFTIARSGGDVRPLTTDANYQDAAPAWSPDGEWVAFLRENNGIWLVRPDGSETHSLSTGVFDLAAGLSWSPDGTELMAVLTGRGLTRVPFATGQQNSIGHLGPINGTNPWSPDGTRITFLGRTPPDINGNTGPSVVVASPDATDPVQVSPDSVYGSGQSWLPPVR